VSVRGIVAPIATLNNFTVNVGGGSGGSFFGPVGLYVAVPPSIFKSYDRLSMANGSSTKLSFFVTNDNDISILGATFVDDLGALGLNIDSIFRPTLSGGGFCPSITASATLLSLGSPNNVFPPRTTCSYLFTVRGVAVSPLAGTINRISISTSNVGTGVSNNATL
jgi:hypothetical protein